MTQELTPLERLLHNKWEGFRFQHEGEWVTVKAMIREFEAAEVLGDETDKPPYTIGKLVHERVPAQAAYAMVAAELQKLETHVSMPKETFDDIVDFIAGKWTDAEDGKDGAPWIHDAEAWQASQNAAERLLEALGEKRPLTAEEQMAAELEDEEEGDFPYGECPHCGGWVSGFNECTDCGRKNIWRFCAKCEDRLERDTEGDLCYECAMQPAADQVMRLRHDVQSDAGLITKGTRGTVVAMGETSHLMSFDHLPVIVPIKHADLELVED